MKKVLIIGASSGIGASLAQVFAEKGNIVAITGRREQLLHELGQKHPENILFKSFDVLVEDAIAHMQALVAKMRGLDILIYSSGKGELNPELDYKIESETNELNVRAFAKVMSWGFNYFKVQGHGDLVGISSIGGLRGGGVAPAYNASKAYQINYLEGLRQKAQKEKTDIAVIDVRPGFVDTAMAKGDGQFWMAPADKVAHQIHKAILKKREVVYVTKRWRLIAVLLKILPTWLYKRM